MDLPLRETMLRVFEFERSNSRCYMSYGRCLGKKESLLQITVKTKAVFYAL